MTDTNKQLDSITLFGPIDDEWKSTTRSIRINGKVTSVRLENFYWRVIADIAENQELMLSQLMTKLSRLAENSDTDHTNFTSFVRVCCVRYLEQCCAAANDKATRTPGATTGQEPTQAHAGLQVIRSSA